MNQNFRKSTNNGLYREEHSKNRVENFASVKKPRTSNHCIGSSRYCKVNLLARYLCISRLQHVESIDLAWNSLENLNELTQLERLTQLILSHNAINMLVNNSEVEKEVHIEKPISISTFQVFIGLELLDLSYNHITSQTLYRLGSNRLPRLKKLILSGNQINKLDDSFVC